MREIPIGQLADKIGAEIGKTMRGIKIAMFNGVIRDTRVDTGRLRGNWQTTTGAPATGDTDRVDPSGSAAQAEVIANVQADTVDYLTNNLPYAEHWEERDGMIARNVARIERIIKEQVK
jgi:hypothetical protein